MSDNNLILFLCIFILVYLSVVEIKDKKVRAEIKETLELVKKANELCKEAK